MVRKSPMRAWLTVLLMVILPAACLGMVVGASQPDNPPKRTIEERVAELERIVIRNPGRPTKPLIKRIEGIESTISDQKATLQALEKAVADIRMEQHPDPSQTLRALSQDLERLTRDVERLADSVEALERQ